MNMEIIIGEIRKIFRAFNEHFYDGELQEPMILVQTNGVRKSVQGWCTIDKVWIGPDKKEEFELTICSEFLSNDFYNTCDTIAHEMVHLYNLMNGIKDVNANGKTHNKKYKEQAENRGLNVEKDNKLGWAMTSLQESTKKFVDSLDINRDAFTWKRVNIVKPKPTRESKPKFKYKCPDCGAKFTSSKELRAICSECSVEFELQE